MKVKPCGLYCGEVTECSFSDIPLYQLFVSINGKTFIKVSEEEAVILSTGAIYNFSQADYDISSIMPWETDGKTIRYSRMNEPVFRAYFVE